MQTITETDAKQAEKCLFVCYEQATEQYFCEASTPGNCAMCCACVCTVGSPAYKAHEAEQAAKRTIDGCGRFGCWSACEMTDRCKKSSSCYHREEAKCGLDGEWD